MSILESFHLVSANKIVLPKNNINVGFTIGDLLVSMPKLTPESYVDFSHVLMTVSYKASFAVI